MPEQDGALRAELRDLRELEITTLTCKELKQNPKVKDLLELLEWISEPSPKNASELGKKINSHLKRWK